MRNLDKMAPFKIHTTLFGNFNKIHWNIFGDIQLCLEVVIRIWKSHIFDLGKVGRYIEDITRWREGMNFMFAWQEQYLTSERSERV